MITSIKRILRRKRSSEILDKIVSGKTTYFESKLEEIAFKYIPGNLGEPGKYYAKYYDQIEYEIDSDSTSILKIIMEGKKISKARYDKFHLIKGVFWNKKIKTQ